MWALSWSGRTTFGFFSSLTEVSAITRICWSPFQRASRSELMNVLTKILWDSVYGQRMSAELWETETSSSEPIFGFRLELLQPRGKSNSSLKSCVPDGSPCASLESCFLVVRRHLKSRSQITYFGTHFDSWESTRISLFSRESIRTSGFIVRYYRGGWIRRNIFLENSPCWGLFLDASFHDTTSERSFRCI